MRRRLSASVKPEGPRRAERRVKRTSMGIWRREEVRWKMFSGEKMGSVRRV